MSESIVKQVLHKISNYKRGKIFFPQDFYEIGSSAAVRKALNRLEKKEVLIRLAQGIYLYPKKHELLGILYPNLERIAQAIAKRDKARIIPTGINALNKLGLTTQVPMNLVYLTDGTPRIVQVGNRKIKFKIASPRLLSAKNERSILIIQALREIGKENIDSSVLQRIREVLEDVDDKELKHDLKLAPVWISEIVEGQTKKPEHE